MKRSGSKSHAGAAFTVIEVLVATAVTAVLAALMLTLVVNVVSAWSRNQGALTTEGQARLAIDQIARDLQTAMHSDDGGAWIAASVSNDTGNGWVAPRSDSKPSTIAMAPPIDLTDARFGKTGVWLRLITAVPFATREPNVPASPVAISYRIVRRRMSTDQPLGANAEDDAHYGLFRVELTSAVTFNGGYNLDSAAPSAGSTTPQPAAYLDQLKASDRTQLLADNVIDFGVRFYVVDPSTGDKTLTLVYPAADAAPSTYYGRFSTGLVDRFPEVADVVVRVLTPEGVRRIRALENGQITGDWWEIALAYSRVFTRRISLRAARS